MKTQIERAEPSRGAPEAAHTPGPWLDAQDYITAGSYTIARIFPGTGQESANARLIAQAPTLLAENEKLRSGHVVLLEALKAIDALIPEPKRSNSVRLPIIAEIQEIVRAAIQQAERT